MAVTSIAKASSVEPTEGSAEGEVVVTAALLAAADAVPKDVQEVIFARKAKPLLDVIRAAPRTPPEKKAAKKIKDHVPSHRMIQKAGYRMSEVRMLLDGLHKQLYDLMEDAPSIEISLAVALSAVRESAQACNAVAVTLLGDTWDHDPFNDPLLSR